jgi:hypothetical protein
MSLSQALYIQVLVGLAVGAVLLVSNNRVAQSKANDLFSRVINVRVTPKSRAGIAAKQKISAIFVLALSNQARIRHRITAYSSVSLAERARGCG